MVPKIDEFRVGPGVKIFTLRVIFYIRASASTRAIDGTLLFNLLSQAIRLSVLHDHWTSLSAAGRLQAAPSGRAGRRVERRVGGNLGFRV